MIGNISIKIFDSLPTTNLLLISDSDYESNQSETEENHQYSIVPKETFKELQRFSGEWKYTDNSYYMDDNKESYTETKKISCGFFQYMNSNWYNKTGSFMKSLIIKCRYEELKDGNIAVLFTPFVVVKSIRYENAVNICRKLYADTEIGKWLENTTERISYVLLLNLIECFTNLYTWILFESKLKVYFNTSEIKLDLLQSNLNPAFLDTIKMMFTWKQINFESRIEQVNKIGNIATWTQEKNNNVSLNTIEEVYELLYQQVIEMKREKNTDNFVTIEQMENMVSQQNQELLTGSLLQMLDQNILEQNTVYQNGMILHVFRCGNNSDIVLPFYNPYIMYVLFDVLDEIQAYELTDLDEAMERLDDACAFTACSEDEEDTLQAPELLLGDDLSVVVRVPVNGGKLVLANGESDYGTKQIGLMYEKDGDLIDLALAEVKSGELAEIANQEPDNKDIDLYVFANPETEDYTNRYHIPYDKILAD